MSKPAILEKYNELKAAVKSGHYSHKTAAALHGLYSDCSVFLEATRREPLVSLVEGKQYFAFGNGKKISRAINLDLYGPNPERWEAFSAAMTQNDISEFSNEAISKILYSLAISFCASVDLIKDGDQKTPGTFFEYFVAHLFAWRVGVKPRSSMQILNIDGEDTQLPTDFIFNLGPKKTKFHVPVKTSTRERAIMLWAHQRLLDGVYGTGRFMGTPVLLAETKTDKNKREVVEICLPDQWRIYQLYVAKLTRLYYFDLPSAYQRLNWEFPPVRVKPFCDFFTEWSDLCPS